MDVSKPSSTVPSQSSSVSLQVSAVGMHASPTPLSVAESRGPEPSGTRALVSTEHAASKTTKSRYQDLSTTEI